MYDDAVLTLVRLENLIVKTLLPFFCLLKWMLKMNRPVYSSMEEGAGIGVFCGKVREGCGDGMCYSEV